MLAVLATETAPTLGVSMDSNAIIFIVVGGVVALGVFLWSRTR